MLSMLTTHRELVLELTKREIKSRYKQSVLGYAWIILNPFLQMLVMSFVFSHIVRIPNLSVPYPIFLYAGLLPWTLFATTITTNTNVLVNNASLLTKIYFPREVFVISNLLAKTVDFLLASTVFIALMVWYQVPVTWHVLWVIPIFLIQQLFTYGVSLLLAAANLFYRDILYLINLVMLMWMYVTPIIYSVEIMPERYRFIFQLNPMAVLVNAYRQTVLGGGEPNYLSLGIATVSSLVITAFGFMVFKKLEGVFADVV